MQYTELHRHLDASIRPSTLVELIQKFRIPSAFKSDDDIRRKFWITHPMGSLQEVLDCFVLFQKVLRGADVLERIGREAVEDAKAEGIETLELRYSPTFTSEFSRISWSEALRAFSKGIDEGSRSTGVRVGLICIVSRDYGEAAAFETIDFAVSNKDKFVGVDLAGPEAGYPCRNYRSAFKKAVDGGLYVTVHAGEAAGPENVWEAIDVLGARRIGHGIRSIEDDALIKRLARDKILLETCPTSNVMTRSVAQWKDHPLPRLLEMGVPVSISTDDPGIFGVTLGEEYERCKEYLGLGHEDLHRINEYSAKHSFLRR